jgi:hypothetical protein
LKLENQASAAKKRDSNFLLLFFIIGILTNCPLILLQFPTQNSTLVFPSSFLQDRAMTAAI